MDTSGEPSSRCVDGGRMRAPKGSAAAYVIADHLSSRIVNWPKVAGDGRSGCAAACAAQHAQRQRAAAPGLVR